MSNIPDIRSVNDVKGKRVLVRASLNVPIKDGVVNDDFRLKRMLPTIALLREQGARIILLGHVGREKRETLRPVFNYLNKLFPISFSEKIIGPSVSDAVGSLSNGEVLLLENVRQDGREILNSNDFSKDLASLGEIYVNDAFAESHREHSSIVGIPHYLPSYAGLELLNEIKSLQSALTPAHPSLFALGGAKFETKQPLVEKFLDIYDCIFVGGALANDFFKARGYALGRSLVSGTDFDLSTLLNNKKIVLPIDVVVENETGVCRTTKPTDVSSLEAILDMGPKTVEMLISRAREAEFILWNGPFGNYERGFSEQTEVFAKALASLSAPSVIGGGDTVASIEKLNLLDKFSFVSIGGGAMLDYLLNGTLPGIEALRKD
ncbi:MAG TPA: phosphoglycerate kinase [Candidatus Paceibacterota bacterium]